MATAAPSSGYDNSQIFVWVKGLEGKVNNLLREVDLIKNDFIKKANNLREEIKTGNDDLMELKKEQERLLQKMDIIIKELKRTAGKEEVMFLQKYLDLWSPLHFVTQQDLERMVDTKIASLKHHYK